ncbi:MAG: glutathionylspermidine synthase family protein [Chloroflexi bacterium]|nr:glutathionylspermidine synthase family protein [Chloroflexota bacterium]
MTATLRFGPPLPAPIMRDVRTRMIFEHFKYDPQVSDHPLLVEYPLLLPRPEWERIARCAEQLSRELLAAEAELCRRPALHKTLGLPKPIARLWSRGAPDRTRDARVMRFDFHLTDDGWRISECNCDTPGGYNEAVGFACLMQQHTPGTALAANPAQMLSDAIADAVPEGAHVAMIYPTSFVEDQQILLFLRQYLEARGLTTHLASAAHLTWANGRVTLANAVETVPVDAIVRYYPAEWLPSLRRSTRWQDFFTQAAPPASNPTTALLTQSKRFPLTWDALQTPMDAWREMLPATVDVRSIPQPKWREWVLKPVYGRFGEDIAIPGVASEKLWRSAEKSARRRPGEWIAQKPFIAIPLTNPHGETVYPSVGVYTVNARVAGIYGRLSRTPIVDSTARDLAILIKEEETL